MSSTAFRPVRPAAGKPKIQGLGAASQSPGPSNSKSEGTAGQQQPRRADAAAASAASDAIGGKPAAAQTVVANDRLAAAALALLKLESEARKARTLNELSYFIVNEPKALTRAQQVILLHRSGPGSMKVRAVSSITHVDRSSPLVLWFEAVVAALEQGHGLSKHTEFEAGAYPTEFDSVRDTYPLRNLLWVPLIDLNGDVVAGLLQARSTPWTEYEIAVSSHLANGFVLAWQAMSPRRNAFRLSTKFTARAGGLTLLALAALSVWPVSMSALAPVEVAPRDPLIVTSGVEGVVDTILVEPNAAVKQGQLLIRMTDTILKNKLEIAEREVLVAQTKYKKAAQLAFVDVRGRHELALAQAELELKTAERNFARDLFDRATIKAERDGIVLFSDKKDLIGRPVAIGEKLMEVATPGNTQFNVDLGVADAIVLHDDARVKVFLDSAPLSPIEAKLIRADYQARPRDAQQMAFRLVAETVTSTQVAPQLGVRGTAQVYGSTVALGFYLLRRPIAAVRQWIGI